MKSHETKSVLKYRRDKNLATAATKSICRLGRETGHIHAASKGLTNFPSEIFHLMDNLDSDEKYWESHLISKIDLSHNRIASIPAEIKSLFESLNVFRIRDNEIGSIPDELCECSSLLVLDVAINQLQTVNPKVSQLCNLRELYLFANKLKSLPESLVFCQGIQVLEIQDNHLRTLPADMLLPNLTRLVLSGNILTELPDAISNYTALTYLDCKKNKISLIPDLSSLSKLVVIEASQNKITHFPKLPSSGANCLARIHLGFNCLKTLDIDALTLSQRSCLAELHVNDNALTEIPAGIAALDACKILDFSNNNVSDLPATLGWMNSLQKILLEGNPIRTIRRTLLTQSTEDLKKYLRTRGDSIESGVVSENITTGSRTGASSSSSKNVGSERQQSVSKSHTLDPVEVRFREACNSSLDLSRLTTAVSGDTIRLMERVRQVHNVTHLRGLLCLDLRENNLESIPVDAFCDLLSLHQLLLAKNNLGRGKSPLPDVGDRPPFLSLPACLKILDLSHNSLQDAHLDFFLGSSAVSSAASISPALTELNLSNNRLTSISPCIAFQSSLRELRLSMNRIQHLISLASMKSLEVLDLTDNALNDISLLTLCDSSSLKSLSLQNNAIYEVPPALGYFPQMTFLGLHGNPQKALRPSILGNTDALLRALRMRSPAPPPQPVVEGKIALSTSGQDTVSYTSLGGGGGERICCSSTSAGPSAIDRSDPATTSSRLSATQIEALRREIQELENALGSAETHVRKMQLHRALSLKRGTLRDCEASLAMK